LSSQLPHLSVLARLQPGAVIWHVPAVVLRQRNPGARVAALRSVWRCQRVPTGPGKPNVSSATLARCTVKCQIAKPESPAASREWHGDAAPAAASRQRRWSSRRRGRFRQTASNCGTAGESHQTILERARPSFGTHSVQRCDKGAGLPFVMSLVVERTGMVFVATGIVNAWVTPCDSRRQSWSGEDRSVAIRSTSRSTATGPRPVSARSPCSRRRWSCHRSRWAFSGQKTTQLLAYAPPPARSGHWRLLPDPREEQPSGSGNRQVGGVLSLLPHALRILAQSHRALFQQKKSQNRVQRPPAPRTAMLNAFALFLAVPQQAGWLVSSAKRGSGRQVRSCGPRSWLCSYRAKRHGGVPYIMTAAAR